MILHDGSACLTRVAMRILRGALLGAVALTSSAAAMAQKDPGVRGGAPGAGGPLTTLTPDESAFFIAARSKFQEVDAVANGLGPRFNANSCAACHAQPAIGG